MSQKKISDTADYKQNNCKRSKSEFLLFHVYVDKIFSLCYSYINGWVVEEM